MLTVIEQSLPTVDSLRTSDKDSVIDCLTFVCNFTWHYFAAVGSSLRLRSANSLMIELFRLDVCYEFTASTATQLRSAWLQGLKVAAVTASEAELSQYVNKMMSLAVGELTDCSHVRHLSAIVSQLWHVTAPRVLDVGVIGRALNSSCCTLMRSPVLLTRVLDRSLFLRSLDGFELAAATADAVCDSRAMALAAFTAKLLLSSWKPGHQQSCDVTAAAAADDDNNDVNDDDDDGSGGSGGGGGSGVDASLNAAITGDGKEDVNSLYVEMLIDIAVVTACIQTTQANISQQQELQQDFANLIGRLSCTEAERLIGCCLERSMANGEVWSLVLDTVLRQLQSCNASVVERSLPTDPELFVPLTLTMASTLCVILPRMWYDTRQFVAEITFALLMTCDKDRTAAFDSKYVQDVEA